MQVGLKLVWSSATLIGVRKLIGLLPRSYADTAFFFDGDAVRGHVALTIDDGLSRGGSATSMVDEVRKVLAEHGARATFFVCTKYIEGEDMQRAAASLVADGHELANHLGEDVRFRYPRLSAERFDRELCSATAAIEAVPGARVRWFRAPQGVYTKTMAEAVRRRGLRHALGDSYADDWAMSRNAPFVSRTILRQATHGSVVILHQPERGFREHTLVVLREVLRGLAERGLQCVTLSQLEALAS